MKKLLAQHLWWSPNAITLCRVILSVLAFVSALQQEWVTGLWLLIAALITDFFNGLVARKLNVTTTFGEEFDALTDSLVVILGMLSLSISGHLAWWVTLMVLATGVVMSSDRLFDQPLWKWRAVGAVICLFIAWTGIVWMYASLAFGWSWLYIPFTLAVLTICGVLKRHRIRAWLLK